MVFVRRRRRPRATPAKAVAPVHGLTRPGPPAARPQAPRLISWMALALLTVGSVGNLGSAPPLAVLGLASVFLYVLPALVFLVPVSLVAAELASGWPGGVYNWVSEGISAPMGLLAVWCEFAQTIFFYPALLAYVADTLAYVFDPGLAGNGVYNAVVIIVLYWGGVLLCSRGQAAVARLGSGGTLTRDGDPGRDPRRARRRIPGPGTPPGRADDGPPSAAGVERAGQHRPGRQQLLHLRRRRSQRRARRRTPQPGPRVPEVHLPGHGAGPGRLHRPDAGDLLGDSLGSDQLHRRRDAGLQQPVHPLRRRVRRAADRDRPGGRGARRDDLLAGRPVGGAAGDRARSRGSSRPTSRRSTARASRCAFSPRRAS